MIEVSGGSENIREVSVHHQGAFFGHSPCLIHYSSGPGAVRTIAAGLL